ncbi:MAG: response regulator [Chloroflexi bacterium]|nr:response regulator [Chloroflexota bacterium]
MIRILIVEDDDMLQEILAERLNLRGYGVEVASNGQEGVDLALAHHPDIILMDMRMPVLDGWEATRKLKAQPETCMIPVIALTAHSLVGDREESLAAGCDEYEPKPVNFERLLRKIEQLVGSEASSKRNDSAGN